ncbi:hypothetical protein HYH03_010587 [Edaphochlamys debaryana]|uniref:Glycoprotease 1 n=1 Tax=Edaphochlamys debaryana TaxID=47281 RepID=A0A835XVW2_9CHLO|nr:hypothetical protein HYH03_010587 [Edaphochlamys debaryana]|eukprot:KAG2491146.1 hypothetical protein HYH03_010587 [Edaphochlamys debaryana]
MVRAAPTGATASGHAALVAAASRRLSVLASLGLSPKPKRLPYLSASAGAGREVAASTSPAAPAAPPVSAPPAVLVLGIESSCDDTGIAVVDSQGRVLGEAIATQADVHAQWGGVVPNLARDAHAAAIDAAVEAALAAAGVGPQQLGAVAVTVGPGLGLCLRVGVAKARQIARTHRLPLVAVHHMEAHALVARLPAAAAAAARPAVRMAAVTLDPAAAPGTGPGPAAVAVQGAGAEGGRAAGSGRSEPPMGVRFEDPEPGAEPSTSAPSSTTPALAPASTTLHTTPGPSSAPAAAATPSTSQGSSAPLEGEGGDRQVDVAAVAADLVAAASVPFPFLCLLVSGGHNLLLLVRGVGSYVQLGTTVDDALGEAYDKVARLLGLELRPHGGAALEAVAREGDTRAFKFAEPMRKYATCDFSFAGLKTSTRLAIEQALGPERRAALGAEELRKTQANIAASFQAVAVAHLTNKTRRGVAWARELEPGLGHLVVAGGVAANGVVRAALKQLAESEGLQLVLPPPRWCTDNGVMVAWAGVERLAHGWAEPPPPPLPLPEAAPAEAAAPGGAAAPAEAAGAGEGQGAGAGSSGSGAEAEWIELKPRWPLTSEVHPRCAAARAEERRSVKRVRMATPLSDLMPPSLGGASGAGASGAGAGAVGQGAAGQGSATGAEVGAGATACPLCKKLADDVQQVAEERASLAGAGRSQGLEVLQIDAGEQEKWAPELLHYKVKAVPAFVLLDGQGRAVASTSQPRPYAQMQAALHALVERADPAPAPSLPPGAPPQPHRPR